jgi:hypothetical protein
VALSTSNEDHEATGIVNQFYEFRWENTEVIYETGKSEDNSEEHWTKWKQKKIAYLFISISVKFVTSLCTVYISWNISHLINLISKKYVYIFDVIISVRSSLHLSEFPCCTKRSYFFLKSDLLPSLVSMTLVYNNITSPFHWMTFNWLWRNWDTTHMAYNGNFIITRKNTGTSNLLMSHIQKNLIKLGHFSSTFSIMSNS